MINFRRKEMNIKVTILIATYNQSKFLENAIKSALNQDYPKEDYEVLVINDGSTDDTGQILSKYEENVRVIHNDHVGLVETCNQGIKEAQGEYFIRLDSDDVFDSKILSLEAFALDNHPNIVGVYCNRVVIYDDRREEVSISDNDIYEMTACGVMMRTELLIKVGGYRKIFWEEYDLFIRLLNLGNFFHIGKSLYFYRRHGKNMTAEIKERKKGWRELIALHGIDKIMCAGDYNKIEELRRMIKE